MCTCAMHAAPFVQCVACLSELRLAGGGHWLECGRCLQIVVLTVLALFCMHGVVVSLVTAPLISTPAPSGGPVERATVHAQVMLMDRERWALNVAVTSTLGMTLMGQYGAMQSAKLAGWISPYPIEAMMLFLPLTMGLHHRVLLVGEARVVMSDRLSRPEAGNRSGSGQRQRQRPPPPLVEALCANVMVPAACTACTAALSLLLAGLCAARVPVLRGCCVVGAIGVVLDVVLLGTVLLPTVALWQRRSLPKPFNALGSIQGGDATVPARVDNAFLLPVSTRVAAGREEHRASLSPRGREPGPGGRWRSVVRAYQALALAGTLGLVAFSLQYAFGSTEGGGHRSSIIWADDGESQPSTDTQSMVPASSSIRHWADDYARWFQHVVSLPVDFPIVGTTGALMDPANGPRLVACVERLRADPRLNASSVRDWYGDFRQYCHSTALCRLTMAPDSSGAGDEVLSPRPK
jgi:hypothetical protein